MKVEVEGSWRHKEFQKEVVQEATQQLPPVITSTSSLTTILTNGVSSLGGFHLVPKGLQLCSCVDSTSGTKVVEPRIWHCDGDVELDKVVASIEESGSSKLGNKSGAAKVPAPSKKGRGRDKH
ncbi:unnamed protein product [Linum trigynum]|uniref:Uncharacterized protein n=1 Tax=Linum trigynum TaxID=586398 RepID=A0AAV2DCI2_9ROSI